MILLSIAVSTCGKKKSDADNIISISAAIGKSFEGVKTPEDIKKIENKLDDIYKAHGYKDRKDGDTKIKTYLEGLQKSDPKKFTEIQQSIMKNMEPMMKAMMQKSADHMKDSAGKDMGKEFDKTHEKFNKEMSKEMEKQMGSKKDHPTKGDAKKPEEKKDAKK